MMSASCVEPIPVSRPTIWEFATTTLRLPHPRENPYACSLHSVIFAECILGRWLNGDATRVQLHGSNMLTSTPFNRLIGIHVNRFSHADSPNRSYDIVVFNSVQQLAGLNLFICLHSEAQMESFD